MVSFMILFSLISSCQYNLRKEALNKDSLEINRDDFEKYIKQKPYTILYFWASWCGLSQNGLIDDYSKNYEYLNNNDTVQSLLIVVSDTSSINTFMLENNIKVPYKCLRDEKYPPLIRNFKDGKNMEEFLVKMFNYELQLSGFPTVILVDSLFNGLMESDNTETAVRIYRYFEKNSK